MSSFNYPEDMNALPSTIPFEKQQRIPRYTLELLLLEKTKQEPVQGRTR